jgi:hypothetical protein
MHVFNSFDLTLLLKALIQILKKKYFLRVISPEGEKPKIFKIMTNGNIEIPWKP